MIPKLHYRAIIDSSLDAVVVMTPDGRVCEWNPAATELFGWTRDEAMGQSVVDLTVTPTQRVAFARFIDQPDEFLGRRVELPVVDRGGREFPVEMSLTASGDGDDRRLTSFIRDLTEHHAERRALATMSHEIRTPMNAVIGLTELLLDSGLDPHQRHYVEMVQASGESLLVLIDDMLDYAKADAGRLELHHAPFDLRDCLEQALDATAPAASAKGLELCHSIAPDACTALVGDAGRLRQVLVNLLSNAVKFTDRGEVEVMARTTPLPDERLEVALTVRDTGVGIHPDQVETLFEPFRQADASTTRKYGGTGLGLAIVRQLARAMDGHVAARPGEDGGSVFEVVVRLAPGPRPLFDIQAMHLRGHTAVVVAANDALARTLLTTVRGLGLTARRATLEGARSAGADVVITDGVARVHDGPTVTLTAFGDPDAARIPHAVSKPVKAAALRTALAEALTGRTVAETPATGPDGPGTQRALEVLLAEDNAVNQVVGRQTLERLGHAVTVVANGADAIDALLDDRYDVVLMDVEMPELDGLDATRRIRAALSAEDQPTIIGVTAGALAEDRDACMAAGMDAYLAKPLRAAELAELLARLDLAVDHEALHLNTGEDDEIAAELIDLFLVERAGRTEALAIASERGDLDTLRRLAHALRSGALVLGLRRLVAACEELERLARAGAVSPSLGASATVLRELERAASGLRAHRATIRSSSAAA